MEALGQHTPHFFGGFNFHVHSGSGHRVVPFEACAREVEAMPRVGWGRPIDQIPNHRIPHRGGVPPDLVRPPRLQTPLHKAGFFVHAPRAVSEAAEVGTCGLSIQDETGGAPASLQPSCHPRVVRFGELRPLGLQFPMGGLVFGEQNGALGAKVQAMHKHPRLAFGQDMQGI